MLKASLERLKGAFHEASQVALRILWLDDASVVHRSVPAMAFLNLTKSCGYPKGESFCLQFTHVVEIILVICFLLRCLHLVY